jgi:hypothetical protein
MPASLPAELRCSTAILSLVCVVCCAMAGCAILKIDHKQEAEKPALPPLVAPKDALRLEVFYIERGAEDALIEALWRQLDEFGPVKTSEVRARLHAAGLRVGLAGTNAPQTLRTAYAEQLSTAEHGPGGMQTVSLLAGQETTIEAAVIHEPFQLRTSGASGERVTRYDAARCVLRISGERQQEGWVRLHVEPELHHGPTTIQPTVGDGAWKLQQGQKIDHLYEQQFDVELGIGELVVVGLKGDEEDSVGGRFFRSGEAPTAKQRVLVIRVADIQKIEPVRSKDF